VFLRKVGIWWLAASAAALIVVVAFGLGYALRAGNLGTAANVAQLLSLLGLVPLAAAFVTLLRTRIAAAKDRRRASLKWDADYHFHGRGAALDCIRGWLNSPAEQKALVVTGPPGSGKSAILQHIVTTALNGAPSQPEDDRDATRAAKVSIACDISARSLGALEIAAKIAEAAEAEISSLWDFIPVLKKALAGRGERPFNVIIDALDESSEPGAVIREVIRPLVQDCAGMGARVVVGSRSSYADGNLEADFVWAQQLVDLDEKKFFDQAALADYAKEILQMPRASGKANPYAQDSVASPVAARIAVLSEMNFLVAGLTARQHGIDDKDAVKPEKLNFSPDVGIALRGYLKSDKLKGASAEELLLALAYAEAPGLPVSLWLVALKALKGLEIPKVQDLDELKLLDFTRSEAANFLVRPEGKGNPDTGFRLFHQALTEVLLKDRGERLDRTSINDEEDLARAFIEAGKEDWSRAPAYLLHSLPGHAYRAGTNAGMLDELLADATYLLYADLLSLNPLADYAQSEGGQQRARLLHLTPQAVTAGSPGRPAERASERAAMFSVTEAIEGLGATYRLSTVETPYRAAWAHAQASIEYSILRGHVGVVTAVSSYTANGKTYLASTSRDHTVRIWDPATGSELKTIPLENIGANGYSCSIEGKAYLVTATETNPDSGTYTVAISDPGKDTPLCILHGRESAGGVLIDEVTVDGKEYLAMSDAMSDDLYTGAPIESFAVRVIQDPDNGRDLCILTGHTDRVTAICSYRDGGKTYLATTGRDQTVRFWDPETGTELHSYTGHTQNIWSICSFTLGGAPYVATGSVDATIRIWAPRTSGPHDANARDVKKEAVTTVYAHAGGGAICLATATSDGTLQIRNPATGEDVHTLTGLTDGAGFFWRKPGCAYTGADGKIYLAVATDDCALQIWDPDTGIKLRDLTGHAEPITAVCSYTISGKVRLATASTDGTVRIWDPAIITDPPPLAGGREREIDICAYTVGAESYLATVTETYLAPVTAATFRVTTGENTQNIIVRIWDLASSSPPRIPIWADGPEAFPEVRFCSDSDARACIAITDYNGTVQIRDLATGVRLHTLTGHQTYVGDICEVVVDDVTYLATASEDCTVRIWDPAKEADVLLIQTRDPAYSLAYAEGLLTVGLARGGVLGIQLNLKFLRGRAGRLCGHRRCMGFLRFLRRNRHRFHDYHSSPVSAASTSAIKGLASIFHAAEASA
jgi:WD40 repeat protein